MDNGTGKDEWGQLVFQEFLQKGRHKYMEMAPNLKLTSTNRSLEQEIAERKQTENALRESEERYRILTEATFVGVCLQEGEIILDFNDMFANMFGYQRTELGGRNILDLVALESRDAVARHISEAFQGAYEVVALKKDGSRIFVEIRGSEINYKGRLARETVVRDITARKEAEEEIRQAHDRLEERVAARTAELRGLSAVGKRWYGRHKLIRG